MSLPPVRLACVAVVLALGVACVGCSSNPVEEHANYVVSNDFLRDFAIGLGADDGPARERLVKDAGDRVAEELRGEGKPSRASMEVVLPVMIHLLHSETKPGMLTSLLTAIGEYRTHARAYAADVASFENHSNEDVANLATYVQKRLTSSGETPPPDDGGSGG